MRSPRILVAENDPRTLYELARCLEALGYEVSTAADGHQAVERARSVHPDLGLVDVDLPGGVDGVQAADIIHEELEIPVVFLTTLSDDDLFRRARTSGSYGYVAKPFSTQVLLTTVELALHRHKMERALALSEKRFRLLFEQNPAGVVVETADGRILECNATLARMLGYASPDELKGRPAGSLFDDPLENLERRKRVSGGDTVANEETRLRHKQGRAVWVVDNALLVPDPLTGRGQILRTVLDISERKLIEEGLERLAYRDQLTGLPNRRLLEARAEQTLAEANRRGEQAALLFLDLVGFKRVNDTMGHRTGDELIVAVAHRLERCLRRTDSAARFGGDEFLVLLSGVDKREGAQSAAERLLQQLSETFVLDGKEISVLARAGIALYPDEGHDLACLMTWADAALTRAKALGGSIAVFAEGAASGSVPIG